MTYSVLPDEVLSSIEQETKAEYWRLRQSGISSDKAYAMAMNHRQELLGMANQKWQVDETKANTPSDTKQLLTALGMAGAGGLGYALGPKLIGKDGAQGLLSQGYDAVKGILGGEPGGSTVAPAMPEAVADQLTAASPKEPWSLGKVNAMEGIGGPDPLPAGIGMDSLAGDVTQIPGVGINAAPYYQPDALSAGGETLSSWGLPDTFTEPAAMAEAPGMMGGYVLPGAAAVIGGWQGLEGVKEGNPIQAGLGGAGLGVGGTALLSNLGLIGAVNPIAAGLIGAAVLGGGALFGGRKTTKEIQAERQQALRDKGITGYAEFMDQIDTTAPGYGEVPDMGALGAEDVWGSEGVFSTFGNDWLGTYNEDQRRQIAQRLLDEGLFQGDKGDMIIHSSNQDRARQIRDEIINSGAQPETPGATPIDPASSVTQGIPKIADLGTASNLIAGMTGDAQSPLVAALMASQPQQAYQPYTSGAFAGLDYSQIAPYLKNFTGVMR